MPRQFQCLKCGHVCRPVPEPAKCPKCGSGNGIIEPTSRAYDEFEKQKTPRPWRPDTNK